MNDDTVDRKQALRLSVLAARRDLTPEEGRLESDAAVRRLLSMASIRRSPIVLLYAAMADECDPGGVVPHLTARGQRVAYPRVADADRPLVEIAEVVAGSDLAPGYRGILEPTTAPLAAWDLEQIECAVIPGVAFDLDGGRLGHGAGHYDRLMGRLPDECLRIGLAYSCQIVPRVPMEEHDEPVDAVVTSHTVHFTGARRPDQDA